MIQTAIPSDIVPYRIRLGVTGHRTLSNLEQLKASLQEILTTGYRAAFTPDAQTALSQLTATPITFSIVSPLAEGADRLVAQAVLDQGGLLEALLPMPEKEYLRDFATPESRREFAGLLSRAHRCEVTDCGISPNDPGYRDGAYRKVGEETLARCDILIALWDKQEPRSNCGTGAIARLAIDQGKPVFIVSPHQPETATLVHGGTLGAPFLTDLNRFNACPLPSSELADYAANEAAELFKPEVAGQLPEELKAMVKDRLVPAYCRASIIAKQNQIRYFFTGKRAYLYATLSVAFMAGAIVFAKFPVLALPGYLIELALLILLYRMIHRAMQDRIHFNWLEHRVLAERLRMAFYFVSCGERPTASDKGLTVHQHAGSWIEALYQELIYQMPAPARPTEPSIRVYGAFIREGWLRGQLKYHGDKKATEKQKNQCLKKWGLRCFALAIGVSVIHHLFAFSAVVGHHASGLALLLEEILSVVAVTLPAAGAAINGYRSLAENSRIASRSAGMAHHLERMDNWPLPTTAAELRHYLERIEDLMLMESQDWHKFMEHALLENIA